MRLYPPCKKSCQDSCLLLPLWCRVKEGRETQNTEFKINISTYEIKEASQCLPLAIWERAQQPCLSRLSAMQELGLFSFLYLSRWESMHAEFYTAFFVGRWETLSPMVFKFIQKYTEPYFTDQQRNQNNWHKITVRKWRVLRSEYFFRTVAQRKGHCSPNRSLQRRKTVSNDQLAWQTF